jgi:hypothetical protein
MGKKLKRERYTGYSEYIYKEINKNIFNSKVESIVLYGSDIYSD